MNYLFNKYVVLGIIILLGFLVRIYKIDNPIADWHAWRQADTASVARYFYQVKWDPFTPKYDDMSGVAENPVFNTERYRFVEFPIYETLVYLSYLINGGITERAARLVSVLFSLGSIIWIFLLVKRYWDVKTALLSSFLFASLPFSIFFSRVVLPEPSLVFFCLGMLYIVDCWIWEGKLWQFVLGVVLTACAFLTKPMAMFYVLPLFYSYLLKEKQIWPIPKRYLLFLISAFLPFALWRFRISQHPEGIPASNWLFNGSHIRFRPAFWKWIVGDRFGREILGVTGSILYTLGLLIKPKIKEGYFLHILGLSLLLYLVVFATGNVQHDYYQYMIVPGLVIFVARGFVLLAQGVENFIPKLWTLPLACLLLVLTVYLTWNEVKGLYQINNGVIVEAGWFAARNLPKDAKVVAPYNGDTTFLYYTNRPGFPNVPIPIKDLIDRFGITHYVSVNFDDETNYVMKKYTIVEQNPRFVIVDLRKENPKFDQTLKDPTR